MEVTRDMMITKVSANLDSRLAFEEKHPSKGFAKWGANNRIQTAKALLRRLENGVNPTTQEVVAYFGKGARFDG